MTEILLSGAELMSAALVGVMRQTSNVTKGRQDRAGCQRDQGWQVHIEGACGEMVVAKALGIFWNGNLGRFHLADVAGLQVRTTSRDQGRLILHESDKDTEIFILVTGTAPRFDIRGWVYAREGKMPRFWKDPAGGRPAWFVDQDALRPIEQLKAWREGKIES